jgi:YD repeat-containing protein
VFRNLYGLTCVVIALGIYVRLSGFRSWGYLLFLLASVLFLERTLFWRLRAAAVYRASPSLGGAVEVKIEESDLVRRSAAGCTNIRWANISHATKPRTCSSWDWSHTIYWCFPNGHSRRVICSSSKNFEKKNSSSQRHATTPILFAGSTINWGWPGWNLKHAGKTYMFPDPNGASRPEQGALIGIRAYDGKNLALTRDATGDLLHARSPAGHQLDFKYDPNHRIVEVTDREGGHFQYSYDTAGHPQRVKDSDQHAIEYGYDELGRLNRLTENGTQICALTYDEIGRVKSELIPGHTYLFRYSTSRYASFQVKITDSFGPLRTVRIAPTEYTLEFPAAEEKR